MSDELLTRQDVKKLRINTWLENVCNRAGIKMCGCQMEYRFEPEKIIRNKTTKIVKRSCKYDRYFHSNPVCPSDATVALIEKQLPGTAEIFYQPIWDVLVAILENKNEWGALLTYLHPSIYTLVFAEKRSTTNQLIRRKFTESAFKKVFDIGDLHSLASLFILRFENKREYLSTSMVALERQTIALLYNLSVLGVGEKLGKKLYEFYITQLSKIPNRKTIEVGDFEDEVTRRGRLLNIGEASDILFYCEQYPYYLRLVMEGNTELIETEVCDLLKEKHTIIYPIEYRGFYWLVEQLNKRLSYRDRFHIIIKQ